MPIGLSVCRLLGLVCLGLVLGGAATSSEDEERSVLEFTEHGSVLGPFSSPDPSGEASRLDAFGRGLELMAEDQFEESAEIFDRLWAETAWPEAGYNAALAWYAAGRIGVALERVEGIASALPGDSGVLYLRGVLLQAVGRHEEAVSEIDKGMKLAREGGQKLDEAVALLNLAASSRLLGRPDEALSYLAAAREIGESIGSSAIVAATWLAEGRAHLNLGDREAGDAALAKARRLGKRRGLLVAEIDAEVSQALVAHAEGRDSRARSLAAKAAGRLEEVVDGPSRAQIQVSLAELFYSLGDLELAEAALRDAAARYDVAGLEVGAATVLSIEGKWALDAGDLRRAEAKLGESLAVHARYQVPLAEALVRVSYAKLRAAQGRLDEGLTELTASIAVFESARSAEQLRVAIVTLVEIQTLRGDYPAAREAAVRAQELASGVGNVQLRHDLQVEVAVLEAASGRLEEALAAAAAVPGPILARMPPSTRGRLALQLGWAFRQAGRHEEALGAAEDALAAARDEEGMAELRLRGLRLGVYSLVDAGQVEAATRFLAEHESLDKDLHDYVAEKRSIDDYNAGVDALQEGRVDEAIAAFEALATDESADTSRREVAERALQEGLLRKSYELLEADDLEQAELALEQMREVAVRREDGAAQARALFLLGRIRVQVEDVARGAELASEAARLALAAEDRELAGSAYMVVGNALFESEPEQSRAAYGQALVAWNGSSSSLGMRASVTYNLAALELQLGDEGAAKLRLKEARVLAKDAGNAGLIARIDEVLQGMESAE